MKRFIICGIMILLCMTAFGQDKDINRYTLFTGFDYMISPARNLTERGFETDFGVTAKPWLGLGGDFGILGDNVISGAGTIGGSETIYAPAVTAVGINPNDSRGIQIKHIHLCIGATDLLAEVQESDIPCAARIRHDP